MKYPSLFSPFNTSLMNLMNFNSDWDPILSSKGSFPQWYKTNNGASIDFDLPGLKKEDIKIEVVEGILKVSGTRSMNNEYGNSKKQYSYQTYLPEDLNEDTLQAKYDNGVLTLSSSVIEGKTQKSKIIPIA